MPEISQKLISFISHAFLAGIVVVVLSIACWSLSLRVQKCPKPPVGLLIATAFIILELIFRPSRFMPRPEHLLFMIVLALWLTRSISYWDSLRYAMLPLSVAGIFLTVPDTENVALLLGILIPASVFAWPLSQIGVGTRVDGAGLAAIVSWVICLDGQGRPASIIVSLGCLGLLMVVPLVHLFRKSQILSLHKLRLIPLLVHALSIAVALGLARTTKRLDFAAAASLFVLGISTISVIVISKAYYNE
jgi:hypothetical protein